MVSASSPPLPPFQVQPDVLQVKHGNNIMLISHQARSTLSTAVTWAISSAMQREECARGKSVRGGRVCAGEECARGMAANMSSCGS
jgi:hypothetical protein